MRIKESFEDGTPILRDTAFDQLMHGRIHGILLLCSNYDAFLLEEDGRIEEQIYNECVSLNLHVIPGFYHADSEEEAFRLLQEEPIDLVIEMLNISGADSYKLSHRIKSLYPNLPVVMLTNFSREVSLRLQHEDLSAIDYVFCWLGNADLLLAIYKLIEDQMNVENDVKAGVQTILLVEDSIRFTSIYLPFLYKMIFSQSMELMKEGLNEHQQLMRMRGRPKILLAKNYEEAVGWYQKYKSSMLGVISDVRFKPDKNSLKKTEGGLELCRLIRKEYPRMPIILQSSDGRFEEEAQSLQVGFIHKFDIDLLTKLEHYITEYFCFGSFIFRDPTTGREVARADDLTSLHSLLASVPDVSLNYHVSHHHISKWLHARGLFSLGELFRTKTKEDFASTREIRQFLMRGIDLYRSRIGQGVIAQYDPDKVDKYTRFSRIGTGSVGGKARGLAFADALIKKHKINELHPDLVLQIPITVAIGTDLFDEFMENNQLYPTALSNLADEDILEHFLRAELPESLGKNLKELSILMENPVAIRSSSKLEDSYYEPFAGIYATYMIPRHTDPEVNKDALSRAIKAVYASVFYRSSKSYMKATYNQIEDEKMGIVLQEVCGKNYDGIFYPMVSGVVKSVNYYPIGSEKPSDGVCYLAFGLGKYIVEGSGGFQFSPVYPKKALTFSNPSLALQNHQRYFYALDLNKDFVPGIHEEPNIVKLPVKIAESYSSFRYVASTWEYESQTLRDGVRTIGKKIITFSSLLQHASLPFAEVLRELLQIGEKELGNPVEIEFAMDMNSRPGAKATLQFLQIRPILRSEQAYTQNPSFPDAGETLMYSEKALGNGLIEGIQDIIYIKINTFTADQSLQISHLIENINKEYCKENKNYLLMGPGRWGSSDPSLGIPVNWAQISSVRVIVETGSKEFCPEPSQGTHFFQHLTSFKIGYLSINQDLNEGYCHREYLDNMPGIWENEYLKKIRLPQPLQILIDGEKGTGKISLLKEQI